MRKKTLERFTAPSHEEIMPANDAIVLAETLSDGSIAYNVKWYNCIDSSILIACCDKVSAERVANTLNKDTVGFDVLS